jgi:ABC-2 type transport system permease protein
VDTLPEILQPVSRVLPLTYAVEGLREVMIKGADLASRTVQLDLLVLAGIAVVFVVLAAGTIRREVA